MKKNIINCNYKKRISENDHNNINYHRCSSVEEKINNPRFSHNLEKEFLNVKFLVQNSVERINTLFNNEEFKQKTTSKKVYNNFNNKINIKSLDLNKGNNNFFEDEEDNKVNNTLNDFINVNRKKENKNLLKYSVNEDDEYAFNNNDLFSEVKEFNSNKSSNKNNSNINSNQLKITNFNEDLINGSLLNLESNKLYSNKENNLNLKKIKIQEKVNIPKKRKYKKLKNNNNVLKTEYNQSQLIGLKDNKKKDIFKYIQKGNNKTKQNKQNKNYNNTRNAPKSKINYEKSVGEETNKFSNTQKLKNLNSSLPKENIPEKKNNSNSMLIDINLSILNTDYNISDKKDKMEDNKLLTTNNRNLYKRQKGGISINNFGSNGFENLNKKKYFSRIKNLKINENSNIKKHQNKIKTQDYIKMMLVINEYLINNNLIADYSNQQNKKIIDNFSLFLANNINSNYVKNNNIINNDNEKCNASIKIQRKWRKTKIEKYLINNFIEEESELKNMIINDILKNTKNKNYNIIDIFNNIINNYKLISNNGEDINKYFYYIQKIIQRKLTINEKNILYKEYINKVICKK